VTVVLSPHLDDAVLSAFARLGPGTAVVNVFDGIPPEGTLTLWDRLCGASSSAEQARARLAEDEAVLSSLGVERVSLRYLDALNRDGSPANLPMAISLALERGDAEVLAPLAGGPRPHPDHALVRDAALLLYERGEIGRLTLYADFPYCVKTGRAWPRAMGGDGPDPRWLGRALRGARYLGAWLDPVVAVLSPAERDAKLAAMRGYRTQFDALDHRLRVRGLVSDPALYGREVLWELGPPPERRPPLPLSF
jgi:LmbE family N-acetylglucosaminyl deacetylase